MGESNDDAGWLKDATEILAKLKLYLDGVEREGVSPSQFASFARNMIGTEVPEGGDDNVPGFEYVSRVAGAGYRALAAHGEGLNKAWSEIRRGRYGIGSAMQLAARVTENYYGVLCEAARGPSEQLRPAWLVIPYVRKVGQVLEYTVRIDRLVNEKDQLAYTPFQRLGAGGGGPHNLLQGLPKGEGARIRVCLSRGAVDADGADGDYASFVFLQDRGSDVPLAIVILRIRSL